MSFSRLAIAAAVFVALGSAASAAEHWVFLGTYTSGRDGSKGIYRCKFDDATGKLSAPELAAEMGSPSFVTIHPSKKFLYAVGEGGGKDGGPVVAFALDAKTGKLTKLDEVKSNGSGPCHVSVSPAGDYIVAANYGGGSCVIFPIGKDGRFGTRLVTVEHAGKGTNPQRQEAPHAHCGFFTPDGRTVLVADLGLDRVMVYPFFGPKGVNVDPKNDVVMPPGTGPRHLAIAPDGKDFYVCGELNSTVNVVKGGKVVQSLSTLPNPVKGNSTAECIVGPGGKFVYVSNRGHNSVAVFKVKDDKTLEAAGYITGDIKTPRNFNIDPSGKWMLIASQDGGKVGVWELDATTGKGKETGTTVPVKGCVCVKFVPVEK